MFSPTYFEARASAGARGHSDSAEPSRFCALNVALYPRRGHRWVFTEYPAHAVQRDAERLLLGRSRLTWQGPTLVIELDERTTGLGRPVQGTIRLHPRHRVDHQVALDPEGLHHWWPVAPLAQIDVQLTRPCLRFVGSGYHDTNFGHRPLEHSFRSWSWSRAELRAGAGTAVLYDTEPRAGGPREHGVLFRADGTIEPLTGPTPHRLRRTRWGLARHTRADPGARPKVRRILEDTPFYARSLLDTTLGGADVIAMHESLDLDRFVHPVTQWMLPYRMRRGRRA